jgi:hypothetical protein
LVARSGSLLEPALGLSVAGVELQRLLEERPGHRIGPLSERLPSQLVELTRQRGAIIAACQNSGQEHATQRR